MRAITTAERLLYIPVWTDRLSLRETCLQGQAKSTKFAKSTKCTKSMKFTKCTKFMKSTKCTKSVKKAGWRVVSLQHPPPTEKTTSRRQEMCIFRIRSLVAWTVLPRFFILHFILDFPFPLHMSIYFSRA